MRKKCLFSPPKPRLNNPIKNAYEYLYTDFPDINQVHISNAPSFHAKRLHQIENLLQYRIINNDHTEMNLIYLVRARNLITRCLTNMPRTYITAVLFNTKHTTLSAYIKNTSELLSCITFRVFPDRGFTELVFCVVKPEKQINGIGSSAMAHLKDYLQVINIKHILVYADNSAIGFFERQGFSKKIGLPKNAYKGYIKDYDGATLMHSLVDPYYDYIRHADFTESIQKIIMANLELPTIVQFKEYPVKQLLGITIPLKTPTPVDELMQAIFYKVISSDASNLFTRLIPKEDYPDYYKIIKKPMCLDMIKNKLKYGKYQKIENFLSDLSLIVENVFMCKDIEVKYIKNAYTLREHIRGILTDLQKQFTM